MYCWEDVAILHSFNKKEGEFVAYSAIDFPFSFSLPCEVCLVPPQLDLPRSLTLSHYEWQENTSRPTLKLQFEESIEPETARALLGLHCLVSSEEFIVTPESDIDYLIDYTIIDEPDRIVGKIDAIKDNPAHPLLVAHAGTEKEILIPFVEDFISSIDEDNKNIYMSLPQGLIEDFHD